MPSFSLNMPVWPGNYAVPLAFPVTEAIRKRLTRRLRLTMRIGTNFSCNLEHALHAADRYLYIAGRPPNPVQIVHEWTSILSWEVSKYWEVDPAAGVIDVSNQLSVTHEHRLRSGEVLAYGISILLLCDRLKIGRQVFFFYEGKTARPDFIFNLSPNHRFGIAWKRYKYGLETRWRKSQRDLNAKDLADLTNKKTGPVSAQVAGMLAVYCFYGTGVHTKSFPVSKTRLHLADPPGNVRIMSIEDLREIVIHHYMGVMSRIGNWEIRDRLAEMAAMIQDTYRTRRTARDRRSVREVEAPQVNGAVQLVSRKLGNETYSGSYYSTLAGMAQSTPNGRKLVDTALRNHDYGQIIFHGVNVKVLDMIERRAWEELAEFRDPSATSNERQRSGQWFFTDGVVKQFRDAGLNKEDQELVLQAIKK